MEISPEYSEIQDLTNELSDLSARLTNAINGGALVSDFKFNLLQCSYSENTSGAYYGNADVTDATHLSYREGTGGVTRTYNVINNIKSSSSKPAKLYFSFAHYIGPHASLSKAGTITIYYNNIQIYNGSASNITSSVDISQYVTQNENGIIKFLFKGPEHGGWTGLLINSLRISNNG